jgi:hypothetical protein
MKIVRRLFPSGFLTLVLVGSAATNAQSASFSISQNGKPVGTASFNIIPANNGYDSSSIVHVSMQGLEYQLSKTEQLSSSNELLHVQLSAIVNNSAVNLTAKPDASRFLINISANGRGNTTRLDAHHSAVFLPDFDPGALQTLLTLAAQNNNRDLWAVIPKQTGSIEPVQLATYADQQGTLDGKPIIVHHLIATISGAATDLFSGPENQLLQAELPQQGFALVRDGFILTPPSRPIAAPDKPAANPTTPPAQ